jgi:hypothetical protein
MTFTFNLVAILQLIVAVATVWSALPETRSEPIKAWRLGVAPLLSAVTAIIMLAGDVTNHGLEMRWVVGAIAGVVAGGFMGNRVKVESDQIWGLVRLLPGYAGMVAALGVLIMAGIDASQIMFGHPVLSPEHDPAIGASLFAGFLIGRASTIGVRAARAPHSELH